MVRQWKTVLIVVVLGLAAILPFGIKKAMPWVHWQLRADGAQHCVSMAYEPAISERQMTVCLTDQARKLLRREGVRAGLVKVEGFAAKDTLFELKCHMPMHTIGQEYQRNGFKASQIPLHLPPGVNWQSSCIAGFLHGYMQELGGNASPATYVTISHRTCNSMERLIDLQGCYHALGHGLSRSLENRLASSGTQCAALAAGVRAECAAGAVMELELAKLAARKGPPYIDDGGMAPARPVRCEEVPALVRGSCYSREIHDSGALPQGKALTMRSVTSGRCERAEQPARRTCFIGAGARVGLARGADQAIVVPKTCGTLTAGGDRDACFHGAGFGFSFYQLRKPPRLWKMCDTFAAPDARRCYEGAGRGWALVHDDPTTTCTDVSSAYRPSCERGAALSTIGLGLS